MAITTEEQLIEAIRTKKAVIKLDCGCTHAFRWDLDDPDSPVWAGDDDDVCYYAAAIFIDGEEVGGMSGAYDLAEFYDENEELTYVRDWRAFYEALESYGWGSSHKMSADYFKKYKRFSSCRKPTIQEAVSFLKTEGFTHFYVDNWLGLATGWALYLSTDKVQEFENNVSSSPGWSTISLESAAFRMVSVLSRELVGDILIRAVNHK